VLAQGTKYACAGSVSAHIITVGGRRQSGLLTRYPKGAPETNGERLASDPGGRLSRLLLQSPDLSVATSSNLANARRWSQPKLSASFHSPPCLPLLLPFRERGNFFAMIPAYSYRQCACTKNVDRIRLRLICHEWSFIGFVP
jgi:hypothetical protein